MTQTPDISGFAVFSSIFILFGLELNPAFNMDDFSKSGP
jgi:hypothetical protein